jgi:hypothetical protein
MEEVHTEGCSLVSYPAEPVIAPVGRAPSGFLSSNPQTFRQSGGGPHRRKWLNRIRPALIRDRVLPQICLDRSGSWSDEGAHGRGRRRSLANQEAIYKKGSRSFPGLLGAGVPSSTSRLLSFFTISFPRRSLLFDVSGDLRYVLPGLQCDSFAVSYSDGRAASSPFSSARHCNEGPVSYVVLLDGPLAGLKRSRGLNPSPWGQPIDVSALASEILHLSTFFPQYLQPLRASFMPSMSTDAAGNLCLPR